MKYNAAYNHFSDKKTNRSYKFGGDTAGVFEEKLKYSADIMVDDEFNFELDFDSAAAFGEKKEIKADKKGSKVFFDSPVVKHEFYHTDETNTEWKLHISKPLNPWVDFIINTKELTFHHQPSLRDETESMINAYGRDIIISDNSVVDRNGRVLFSRPDNVVNSYAIYCPKSNNEYGPGKVGHIYAFYAIIDGFYIKLFSEIIDNRLRVHIPLDIYNTFDWKHEKLTIDPSLGYTTVGGSSSNGYINQYVGNSYTASGSGAVSALVVYCSCYSSNSKVVLGLYEGGTKRAQTDELLRPYDSQWYELTPQSNYNITSGNSYKFIAHSAGSLYLQYDLFGPGTYFYNKGSYSSTLDSEVTFSTFTYFHWSIYCNYNEASSAQISAACGLASANISQHIGANKSNFTHVLGLSL